MKHTPDPPACREKRRHGWTRLLRTIAISGMLLLQSGCSQMVLFDPKGPVGSTEKFVILAAFGLMLIVVIPVLIMVAWFPWKFRASNTKAKYTPKWNFSATIEAVVWIVPAIIVTFLAMLAWKTTYHLDPYKPIASAAKPLTIEAVALDWKWLFIYPDQNIATVNQVVFPANVPLSFKLTSDTVMTSFFIPQLGSQIYAMTGMQTQLHLLANQPGTYDGQNQQLSGEGYAWMSFKAKAVTPEQFAAWVQKAKQSPKKLDLAGYRELAKPTNGYPVTLYSTVRPDLFSSIIHQYKTYMTPKTADAGHGTSASMAVKTAAQEEH